MNELRAELTRQVFLTEQAVEAASDARESLRNCDEAYNQRFVGVRAVEAAAP